MDLRANIRTSILAILGDRGRQKTMCPSEAARAVFSVDGWRAQMPLVREVAFEMAAEELIEVCQSGLPIEPAGASGPIRLRLKK
ncbi:MAG: DUF3253 domain-containing protein [Lentimonas sp.]